MDESHKRIALTQRFRDLAATMTIKKLARHYRVGEVAIAQMLTYADIDCVPSNASPNDFAPNAKEEQASRSSLDLSPMVAARAKKIFDAHLKELLDESDVITDSRVQRWRRKQL